MVNLTQNALRAMPDGGQLTIRIAPANPGVQITVTDTGCGIEQSKLPHIFERFYKGKDGGLGLGLAIVKELVEAHNGKISVTSTFGKGTCFLLQLPDFNGGDQP
jgi:signal transduction histidine kinase